jgi:hypothetical protein
MCWMWRLSTLKWDSSISGWREGRRTKSIFHRIGMSWWWFTRLKGLLSWVRSQRKGSTQRNKLITFTREHIHDLTKLNNIIKCNYISFKILFKPIKVHLSWVIKFILKSFFFLFPTILFWQLSPAMSALSHYFHLFFNFFITVITVISHIYCFPLIILKHFILILKSPIFTYYYLRLGLFLWSIIFIIFLLE